MVSKSRVYKKCPKTHRLWDPCRDLVQARSLLKSYPKEAQPIIVKTGESRGRNKAAFPYHIAVLRSWA